MRRCDEQVLDEVVIAGLGALDAPAAAVLLAVGVERDALDQALVGDRDRDLVLLDQGLDVPVGLALFDEGAARGGELGLHLGAVGLDDAEH